MFRKFLLALLMIVAMGFAGLSFGDETKATYIDKHSVVLRVMNKASGKPKTITTTVGKKVSIEKLEILIRSCKAADPYSPENYFAFAQISKSGKRVFSGWMNRNEPGINPLQDADYDVWLVGCD